MYGVKVLIEVEVTNCKEEAPSYANQQPGYRIFWGGGSCKSDFEVKQPGRYRFEVVPAIFHGRIYFRAIKRVWGPKEH